MAEDAAAYRQRIIATCEARREFVADLDGFVKWWPDVPGYLTEVELRIIADELVARNAEWQRTINEELTDENGCGTEP